MTVEHPVPHAAERWALAVVGILDSPFDPKTVAMWGKALGVSEGSLRDWCRASHCLPKPSLDLARLLRAIVQAPHYGWDPFNLLDIAHERTLRDLLRRGGLTEFPSTETPLTPQQFLAMQRYIANPVALAALAGALERHMGA
jgi:hypothetical protein